MSANVHCAPARRQQGAVLLLLLAVIGLGGATLLINTLLKGNWQAARERHSVAILGQAREALVGFAIANGRLPRPAVSATDGSEAAAACATEAACSGFLPWVTLGVEGADSWGKRLRYAVTPALCNAPVLAATTVASKTVQGRNSDGTLVYLAGQANCSVSSQCAPFVVLSQGRANFGTSEAGVAMPNLSAGNLDEAGNQQATAAFISRAASTDPATPGGEFDDLLAWIPLKTLFNRMNAAGKIY